MFIKKFILLVIFTTMLNNCAQNAALVGPAYTLATSGNIYHASLSYGSDKAITKMTGKSTGENIKDLLVAEEKDNEFEKMIKKRIKETRKKLNLSN